MRLLDRRLWAGLLLIGSAWIAGVLGLAEGWGREDGPPVWEAPRDYAGAVEVAGAVRRPGVRPALAGLPLREVLAAAGARVPRADPALDRPAEEGERLILGPEGGVRRERMPGRRLLALGLAIPLDRASAADLEALPGIGPVLAARIVAHRDARGPLRSIGALRAVPGVGPKTLARIGPHLRLTAE